MMGGPPRFGMVYENIWEDPEFRTLSGTEREFVFYLFSCRHNNSLGIFRLPAGYIFTDFGWTVKDPDPGKLKALLLPVSQKFPTVQYDPENEVVLIRTHLKHTPLNNPNQAKHAVKIIEELPSSYLLKTLRDTLQENPDWYKDSEGKDTKKKIYHTIIEALDQRYKKGVSEGVSKQGEGKGDAEADAYEEADAKAEDPGKNQNPPAVGSAVFGEPPTDPPSNPDTKSRLGKGEDDEASQLPDGDGDGDNGRIPPPEWNDFLERHGVNTPKPVKPTVEPATVREEVTL